VRSKLGYESLNLEALAFLPAEVPRSHLGYTQKMIAAATEISQPKPVKIWYNGME
jgi:hypothetical protein